MKRPCGRTQQCLTLAIFSRSQVVWLWAQHTGSRINIDIEAEAPANRFLAIKSLLSLCSCQPSHSGIADADQEKDNDLVACTTSHLPLLLYRLRKSQLSHSDRRNGIEVFASSHGANWITCRQMRRDALADGTRLSPTFHINADYVSQLHHSKTNPRSFAQRDMLLTDLATTFTSPLFPFSTPFASPFSLSISTTPRSCCKASNVAAAPSVSIPFAFFS